MHLVLCVCVRKLRKAKAAEIKPTKDNYKNLRAQFDRLTKISEIVRPLSGVNASKVNWVARPFLKKTIEAANIITSLHAIMAAKFVEMDTPAAPLPNGWEVVTGKELWHNRPSPYEYIV